MSTVVNDSAVDVMKALLVTQIGKKVQKPRKLLSVKPIKGHCMGLSGKPIK